MECFDRGFDLYSVYLTLQRGTIELVIDNRSMYRRHEEKRNKDDNKSNAEEKQLSRVGKTTCMEPQVRILEQRINNQDLCFHIFVS